MSAAHVWRVAAREVVARWGLVPAAVVVATLAMVTVRSLDVGRGGADEMINGTWVATLVISVIVGMSLLGDELSNGRLSFYFTRPFLPSAIFGGKMLGGAVLALVIQSVVIAFVALALPAVAWTGSVLALRGTAEVAGARILATFACVVLGMAVGVAQKSRTRWLVVDLACAATVGAVATWVVVHVTHGMVVARTAAYDGRVTVLEISTLAVAVTGLAIATARALARGRTDRERAHAALSTTLWPILVPAATALLVVTMAWF
jgi:hypothetical protein